MVKKTVLLFSCLLIALQSITPQISYFENPVIRGDIADPSVIHIDGTYYATGTSSEWAPFYPLFRSDDLVNWEQTGHIFNEKPSWTSHSFWAPELYYHDGKIFCYYTARRKPDQISYIGVAVAEYPSFTFRDHGPIVEHGSEAIDAFIFEDQGQRYITWKAYGLDNRPIELLGSRLSDDGLRLEGEPFSLLKDDEEIGMEGQHHLKQGDYYYIIYSAGGCCGPSSDYDVRVARAKDFKGPYEKYEGNPILSGGGGDFLSLGHGTAVSTAGGRYFYLSHGYLKGDAFYLGRQPILHEFFINENQWIAFRTGKHGVIKQPTPFADTVQEGVGCFRDDFTGDSLSVSWTWNYPYASMAAELQHGKLLLSGVPVGENKQGTALCLRPVSTEYCFETKIVNRNGSLKGLTLYGDAGNLVALGMAGSEVTVKQVVDDAETLLAQAPVEGDQLFLKIEVERGSLLTFSYSEDGERWFDLLDVPLDLSYLVRWDRVARPGLIHQGDSDQPAIVDYFTLHNH